MGDATGYGRIVRGPSGDVRAIVEEADADEPTRAIDEVNVGTYCFDAAWLRANMRRRARLAVRRVLPHRPGRGRPGRSAPRRGRGQRHGPS